MATPFGLPPGLEPAAAAGAPSAEAAGAPFAAAAGAPSLAIQQRLRDAKLPYISWHIVLNNHTSTRPNAYGGPLCASVRACKQFSRLGSMHSCRIVLPNSYARGDGKVVEAEATAPDAKTAEEDAGSAVFALLCADRDGLPNVVFRPNHWNVPIEALITDIGRIVDSSATFQPLAVHACPTRRGTSGAMFAGELKDVPEANLQQAAALIRLCLRAHDGSFDPSKINHKKLVQVAGEQEKAYTQLARLLPKGSLRQFIEQHPEFDVEEKEGLLCIKWGSAAPQGPPSQVFAPAAFASVTSASAASGALSAPAPRSAQKNNSSLTAAASGAPSASTSGAPPDFDQMD